jgi:PST family polysaccharide transporter
MFRLNYYYQQLLLFAKRVAKADIVRVFSLTSISTLVRMLTGMISVKIVSTIIGPAGVALLGQLNNFSSIALNLSSGGINSGITKYVSEYKEDKNKVSAYISTALRITVVCSLIVGLLMIILHSYISNLVMLSSEYGYVFVVFGFTILLYSLNSLLTSILNGFKEFQLFVKLSIVSTLFGLVFSVSLVLCWELKGALISAVTFQSVMLFVTLWMLRKLPWLKWSWFKEKYSWKISKEYLHFSAMTLTSIAVVPVSQMILRGYIMKEISPVEAGWWEAMNRLSGVYLSVITTSFGIYYLPRLSELHDNLSLHREIMKSYKVVVPILLVGLTTVYFLRSFVIRILFSPDFAPMENLFMWQQLGDLFKISSWLLAYLMVAKARTTLFIVTEIFGSVFFVLLGFLFMHFNGVVGLTQAYFVNYVAYMLIMVIAFRKIVFCKA